MSLHIIELWSQRMTKPTSEITDCCRLVYICLTFIKSCGAVFHDCVEVPL